MRFGTPHPRLPVGLMSLGLAVVMAASPVLVKDRLIVPMDNAGESFLAAVDTKYGKNVWKVERMLLNAPHRAIRSSDERIDRLRRRYCAFRTQHGDRKPLFYNRRGRWTPLPKGPW